MAKVKCLHVLNLEKYLPSYRDRAYSWVKFYCRDTYDRKSGITYRSILDDPAVEELDEVNRWRFIALVLREAYLGRPVPVDDKSVLSMGWDERICSKSRTLRVLHKLTEVCYTDAHGSVTSRARRSETEKNGKEKNGNGEWNTNGPDGPASAAWLAPDFPHRFASLSLRSLIVPQTKGDETTFLRIAEWVQGQIRAGADGETIIKAVLECANRARTGRRPMALLQDLLQRELGYPTRS